jgi:hypothetical protein
MDEARLSSPPAFEPKAPYGWATFQVITDFEIQNS